MNVSIKPLLISTSSPQMASLIYPFPRILAVHLKYAATITSWTQPHIAKGSSLFCFYASHFFMDTSVSSPARCDRQIWLWLHHRRALRKPERATASFGSTFVFSPCQSLATAPACIESRNWCCSTDTGITTGKASHSQLFFLPKELSSSLIKRATELWWDALCFMGDAEICWNHCSCQKLGA